MSKPRLIIRDKDEPLRRDNSSVLEDYEFLGEPSQDIPYRKDLEGKRVNISIELEI